MKSLRKYLTIFLLLTMLLVGCSTQAAAETPAAASDAEAATAEETIPAVEETPADETAGETSQDQEAPTLEPKAFEAVTLTQQPYVSPSDAFTMNFPENWNCSETGEYRVDCHNPANTSEIIVSVTSTGYELLQDDFVSMANAELVSTYADVKAYTQVSQEAFEGTLINEATWRVGDVYWQGIDRFVRSGAAVYHFTFASVRDQLDNYRPVFDEMLQKVILNSTAMSGAPIYSFRKEYTSREQIFTLEVPTSWPKFVDASSMDRTVVEGYTSPDGRAGIQVAIFSKGSNISQETKGVKSLEIMHALYGWDMRVATDKALQDGREWLSWYGDMKNVEGITYFDSSGTSLWVFSVIWEPATKDIYEPILEEVLNSFAYKTFE